MMKRRYSLRAGFPFSKTTMPATFSEPEILRYRTTRYAREMAQLQQFLQFFQHFFGVRL